MDLEKFKIFIKDQDVTNDILDVELDGTKINVMYKNGRSYTYNRQNVRIEEKNQEINNILNYFKTVAEVVGLKDEHNRNILLNNFSKVENLSEESILFNVLSGEIKHMKHEPNQTPIYPFGFNLSQRQATDNAMSNRLSVIEGPPGTGKTQTILNIIANIIMSDQTVAVTSANNSATANIVEKLQKYNLDFMVAFLGNSSNVSAFNEAKHDLPDMSTWEKDFRWKITTRKDLNNLYNELLDMLEIQNNLAKNKQELDVLEIEYKHFCIEHPNINTDKIHHLNADKSMSLWLETEQYSGNNKTINLLRKIINYFKYRIHDFSFYLDTPDQIILMCQKNWYNEHTKDLESSIKKAEAHLSKFDFNAKIARYSELSMMLFKHKLAHKYRDSKRANLSIRSKQFLKEYPVILSTAYSLSNCIFDGLYDYVIIDESSQVDLVTGALALGCASNAVIVGDLKQLPNVVDDQSAKTTDNIFKQYTLPETYRYKNHSILSAITELIPDIPSVLLREHYRCHPKIIEFCNQKFYNGQLITLSKPKSDRIPLVVYKTKPGNHARNHVNNRQIDVIIDEVIPQQKLDVNKDSIGIVTPYRNQVTALQKMFKDTSIQADTVDKFQGREKDIIVLSMVDNSISDFADQPNRLNVAVSRAIDQLIIVTNGNEEEKDTNVKSLIDYINYNNLTIVKSEVCSIFDCLYKCYESKRKSLIKSKVSEFDSENLMYDLIKEVLAISRFNSLNVATHVPLKYIFRDLSKLEGSEYEYANNILAHCDFIIFNRITKNPILGIEVDGTRYHQENSTQGKRDKMKDNIFAIYNLPLIRFRTDGSQEKTKLIKTLDNLLGI